MGREGKLMLTVVAVTIVIVGLGVYLFSKGQSTPPSETGKTSQSVLVKPDSNKIQAPHEKTVFVEFGDFECPACGVYAPIVKKLNDEFKDNMTFVFRNFPLAQHKYAKIAAYSAESAGLQGKYWEMFDRIYETQDEWSASSDAQSIFEGYAKDLNLDMTKFREGLKSDVIKKKVESDYQDGAVAGVSSTPSFFLDGRKLTNPRSYEDFQTLVKAAILDSKVEITAEEIFHGHFDFKLVINGKATDFTQGKYQESKDNPLDPDLHFHDGNGEVVHLHKRGVTLGQFFKSLKMELVSGCFTLDSGKKYCQDGEFGKTTLEMYVNGNKNNELENYIPQDLDRILITFGSEDEAGIKKQIDSVSDKACIYSEKCPERGKPPTEECVGGLGTGCEEE